MLAGQLYSHLTNGSLMDSNNGYEKAFTSAGAIKLHLEEEFPINSRNK